MTICSIVDFTQRDIKDMFMPFAIPDDCVK